jgi:hypothetical protein
VLPSHAIPEELMPVGMRLDFLNAPVRSWRKSMHEHCEYLARRSNYILVANAKILPRIDSAEQLARKIGV